MSYVFLCYVCYVHPTCPSRCTLSLRTSCGVEVGSPVLLLEETDPKLVSFQQFKVFILRGWPWWWADRPIGLIFPWTWLGSWRFGRGNAEACWGASRAMQEAMPARACQPVSAGAKEEGAGSTPQSRKGSKYQRSQARPGRSWKIQESCPAGLDRNHCFPQNRWPLIHLSL